MQRSASSGQKINYPFAGSLPVATSDGAMIDADSLTLNAGPGELVWAIYEIYNGNGDAEQVRFNPDLSSGVYWLAIADYQLLRWEIRGPFSGDSGQVDVNDVRYVSPGHKGYICIMAFDNLQLGIDGYFILMESPELITHQVIETPEAPAMDAALIDGVPAFAFFDSEGSSLRYAWASSTAPQSAANWTFSTVDSADAPGFLPMTVLEVDDKPVIVYQANASQELRVAMAAKARPDSDNDWQHAAIDADSSSYQCAAAVVGGHVMAAYYEPDLADLDMDQELGYIRFALASSVDPLGPYNHYRLAPAGHIHTQPAIAAVGGKPAVALVNYSSGMLKYASTSAAQPAAPTDWVVDMVAGQVRGDNLRLFTLEPLTQTVLIFEDTGGKLQAASTFRLAPETSDWTIEQQEPELLHSAFDAANIRGLPVVAFAYSLGMFEAGRVRMHILPEFNVLEIPGANSPSTYFYPLNQGMLERVQLLSSGDAPALLHYDNSAGASGAVFYSNFAYD